MIGELDACKQLLSCDNYSISGSTDILVCAMTSKDKSKIEFSNRNV
ncbi:MAG TPA: hypothetical protein PLU67_04695 [Candidatus Kapabacteria bacterium]|nr:hypothetical protein [Candidatus Kapabacteria bacterium]HPP40425.1 hypothetical protein [Candidatus Kapabacteria bacterium]